MITDDPQPDRLLPPPGCRRSQRNKEHQVWMPVPITIIQVPLLGHHIAHCVRLQLRQRIPIKRGGNRREHLSFRSPGQNQLGLLQPFLAEYSDFSIIRKRRGRCTSRQSNFGSGSIKYWLSGYMLG